MAGVQGRLGMKTDRLRMINALIIFHGKGFQLLKKPFGTVLLFTFAEGIKYGQKGIQNKQWLE